MLFQCQNRKLKINEKYRYRKVKIKGELRNTYKSEEVIDNGMDEKTHREKSYWADTLEDVIKAIQKQQEKNGKVAGKVKDGTIPGTDVPKYRYYY